MPTSYLKQWAERRHRGYTQFPQEVIGPITIYMMFSDYLTGNQKMIRCPLNGCFWDNDSAQIAKATGSIITTINAEIYVPNNKDVTGREWISPEGWANLPIDELDKYWSAASAQQAIIMQGISEHEFRWAHKDDRTKNSLSDQIFQFREVSPSTRLFVTLVNPQLFGTPDMRHILLRC